LPLPSLIVDLEKGRKRRNSTHEIIGINKLIAFRTPVAHKKIKINVHLLKYAMMHFNLKIKKRTKEKRTNSRDNARV